MILSWLSGLCLAAAGAGCLYMLTAAVLVGRFAKGVRSPLPAVRGEGLARERKASEAQRSGSEGASPDEALSSKPPHPRPLGLLHRPIQADAALSPHAGRGKRASPPSITILKPLHGDEPLLHDNLASFCAQDYPGPVQIVFGVQDPADPAIAVVRRIEAAFPDKAVDLVVDPRPHGANRKVSNLINMAGAIRHEVVVLADSDMRVPPDYLARVVAALQGPGVGLVTCLYHGVPADKGLWPRLSALAIDTHFLPNVVLALSLGLARPCFGSTIALRRTTLEKIGGFKTFADLLADDYAIGAAVRADGYAVAIPPFTIGHVCTEASAAELWRHELRWARTIRGIDPGGYAGLAVTHAFPLALLAALASAPVGLWMALAAVACRIGLCVRIERAFGLPRHPYWLAPLRDTLSFAVFVFGLFGAAVSWKGGDYRVTSDGMLHSERRSPAP